MNLRGFRLFFVFIAVMLGGLLFDLNTPSGLHLEPSDYAHVQLTFDEQIMAFDAARKEKYLIETGYYHHYFPLQKHIIIGPDSYIWFILEKVGYLVLIGVILWMISIIQAYNHRHSKMLKIPALGYLFVMIGDMADFLLTYNNLEYGKVFGLSITYNVLSFVIYIVIVIYQLIQNGGINLRGDGTSGYGVSHGHY